MPRLTKPAIKAMVADPSKETYLWDSDLPRFGVRCSTEGRKTYLIRYRTPQGASRKHTVGRVSDLHPDAARELARALFARLSAGQDIRQAIERPTIADLSARHMDEHSEIKNRPSTHKSNEKLWRLYILPPWGKRDVADITRADVLKLHAEIGRTHKTIANRVRSLLSKAFNLAEIWGWRPDGSNPCRHVAKFPEQEMERILSPEELRRLGDALNAAERERWRAWQIVPLIRLLLVTGCRVNEIAAARREWVDLERKLLVLPAYANKTARKPVPLNRLACDIIRAIPDDGSGWLLPGRIAGQPFKYPYLAWRELLKRAEIKGRVRLHDLRHTFGSYAHRAGLTQKTVADLLGHRALSTTERYLHGIKTEQMEASEKTGSAITDLMKQPKETI